MPVELNREEFLQRLDEVAPGLSPRDIVEQSACAVFKDGYVCTFNEEVACRAPSGLPKDFKGAVQAEPLRKILRKMTDEIIKVSPKKKVILVEAKRKKAWVRMERSILLPIDMVELPKSWRVISKDFTDAIGVVHECATNEVGKITGCIHITKNHIEAGDGFVISRYTLKTGVSNDVLVKASSIRNIGMFDIDRIAETEKFIHFKGPTGLIISCQRYTGEFPDFDQYLTGTGKKASLPHALTDAAERAEVFSGEIKDKNRLIVELQPNLMKVTGIGASGGYRERKTIKYAGDPMKFMVAPNLLKKLVEHSNECIVDKKKKQVRVNGGRFVWMACLQDVERKS